MSSVKACTKSISQACTLLRETVGVRLRKHSLDARFTPAAVAFLQHLVEALIAKELTSKQMEPSAFSPFQWVLIGDCTSFALPAQFTTAYKGPGGKYPGSAIKLYYEYDFLTGSRSCLSQDGWVDQQTMSASGPGLIKRLMMHDELIKGIWS